MKATKKILWGLVCYMAICLVFTLNPLQVGAEQEELYVAHKEGYYWFSEYKDRVEIWDLVTEELDKDEVEILKIPEMLHGKPVTSFDIYESSSFLKKIIFSKNIQFVAYHIGDLGGAAVNTFEVVTENPYLYSLDGVIYTKGENALMCFPVARRGTVTIPEGVTKICKNAFSDRHLEEIYLPSSLIEIDDVAFIDSDLRKVHFSDTTQKIGASAFYGCEELEDLVLPKNLTTIGKNAFADTGRLGDVEIPKNVQVLPSGVFSGSGLEKITFASKARLKTIGKEAFFGCSRLEKVELPSKLKEIKALAFVNCNDLRKIEIPSSVKKIHEAVFMKKGKRKRLTIRAKKGSYAYKYAKKLKKQRVKTVAI